MKRTDKAGLRNRLNRIEGQVRGIAKMIDDDRYCIDILTQLQAIRSALARVENALIKDHLEQCVVGAMVSGDVDEQRAKAQELLALLDRRGA